MKFTFEIDSIEELMALLALARGAQPDAEVLKRLREDLKAPTDELRAATDAASQPPTP
jgi:hypothetical protein